MSSMMTLYNWITVLFLTVMISTSSSSWPDFDLPDDLPDDLPVKIPDHLPDFVTILPDLFKNLSISVACDAALARMFDDKRSREATLALDACGKPMPGFLVGNLAWLGHWPECKSLEEFHFCTTFLKLNMSAGLTVPVMKWGLCLPDECDEKDVFNSITEIIDKLEYDELSTLNPQVIKVQCATSPPRAYDAGFYSTVILCCVVALLMVSGSLFDVHKERQKKTREEHIEDSEALLLLRQDSKPNGYGSSHQHAAKQKKDRKGCCERFLLSFSFPRNLKQILKTDTKEGSMLCLNGIRVISMTWVILGHTIMLVYQVFGDTWDGIFALDLLKSFPMQAILNAFPSVDSFFLLSGLLITYITLGRMARSDGRIPWALFYFHRYWRLLPGLGAAMLFALYIRPYLGEGPLWSNSARGTFNCDKYWWTNLLFINNFYPQAGTQGCIYWVWYLANDMQFFLISPILLVSLYRKPIVGMIIIAILCVASLATTIGLMVANDFKVALMGFGSSYSGNDIFSTVYIKPYCRITPYLVGMVLGYAFHSWRGTRIRVRKLVVIIGWAVATATGLAVVYGLYGEFNGRPLSTAENAIYMAFGHFAWAIALSWVIFACHYGYGGWINDFLSWKAWIPLCRLTYGAYLFHPLLMNVFVGNTTHSFSVNAVYIAYYFTSCCVFSYLVSLLVSLGFEMPLANLEGVLK
ncbi:nose resistant to fluoxetine protein 6-like [Lytechinus variegatus]|uniref:nose resistant to fluoxetine protein 6-like n=1 Tax=Lytechinus variegatus TaxID=7654 RepID=UPI001BB273F1|nr:nose resistant to fluoxetine protein 6-like [Lytechinus variegatus]